MGKDVRIVFGEAEFRELLLSGQTEIDGITLNINGDIGWNTVNVTGENISELIDGGTAKSEGTHNLTVEFILSDIGYDRIFPIMEEYKRNKDE